MEVSHTTALPYNPQGQDIVERAHSTLKELLQKQKEGIAYGRAPKEQLSLALRSEEHTSELQSPS